jgi:hypothetical protein
MGEIQKLKMGKADLDLFLIQFFNHLISSIVSFRFEDDREIVAGLTFRETITRTA